MVMDADGVVYMVMDSICFEGDICLYYDALSFMIMLLI